MYAVALEKKIQVRSWISHFPSLASRGQLAEDSLIAVCLLGEKRKGRPLGDLQNREAMYNQKFLWTGCFKVKFC